MNTTDRMMIMGMCLQGILANPNSHPYDQTKDAYDHMIASNIKLAHRYADALDPVPETTDADQIARLTRIAYEALRAGEHLGFHLPFDEARLSNDGDAQDSVDYAFERVSRWYRDPVGVPTPSADRIIAAIVRACRSGDQAPLNL